MAKTEMTKKVESAILNWHPASIGDIHINQFRPEYTALECPVEHGMIQSGIIDAVRISEYFGDIENRRVCRVAVYRNEGIKMDFDCPLGNDMTRPPHYCDMRVCRWNGLSRSGTPKILITCIEIKVSKSDFKSTHGHNFVGNMNYYAVPLELYKEIEPMVPDGIGILCYHHEGKYVGLRSKRKPDFREMNDADQKWMLLSAMKRIRDRDFDLYSQALIKNKERMEVWI